MKRIKLLFAVVIVLNNILTKTISDLGINHTIDLNWQWE